MRPVICLIQRLYVRLHGSKVRVDRRTLLRVLHYSFQNASSARCRAALKERLAADTLRTSHSYKCRSTSMINQSSSKRVRNRLWIVDPWRRSLSLSLSLSIFTLVSIVSNDEILFFFSGRCSKHGRRSIKESICFWYCCFGGKYNYLFVVQRIFLFARFSIFPLRKNFSFHLYLSSIFIGIAYPILLHAIALALSLDYSWTRLDCTENSNKMELEEFGMKSSFDKLSSCVHCEIRTFSSFLFSLSPNAEI